MKRVCVVSALYHPNLGGLGRQAMMLSERLREEGVDLFVIARKMDLPGGAIFSPKLEVVRVGAPYPGNQILEEKSLKNLAISVCFAIGCLARLVSRRKTYEIVHFHGASVPLIVSLPFLKLMGKKVVAKVAAANLGTEAGSLSGKYWGFGNLLARVARRVDAFVAISEEIRQGLLRDGIAEKRIYRIDNFVDSATFHPAAAEEKERLKETLGYSGKTLVLCSGRMVPRKGVSYLLEAWKEVAPLFQRARLLVLGEGPLLGDLRETSVRLGIAETAHFLGRVDNLPEYLRAADLFVLPSLQEGMPNALLEAMACGLPSVATRIGGVIDLGEDGKSAFLVPPGDPSGLAAGIRSLLSDPALRTKISEGAVQRIHDFFGLESRVGEYLSLYSELLKSR